MRNIFLVVAPIGGGKTEFIKHAKGILAESNIPFDPNLITDSDHLMAAIRRDHEITHGLYHVHTRQMVRLMHDSKPEDDLDSIAIHPQIQQWMFENFFAELNRITLDGHIHFAEMATGVNGTPDNLMTAQNDYSNQLVVDGLRSGLYPKDWIDKVAGVFLISSDFKARVEWNDMRLSKPYVAGEDITGDQSRPVPREVMDFTKGDDSKVLREFLEYEHNMQGMITQIHNDGTPQFLEQSAVALLERINHRGLEGSGTRKESR